ncbi:MAG: hypothetical protein R3234_12930 [Thermoanaerobaculia bacterium]|nr:hypothetical protein [Thermoanaerobaculia bacterium]
MLGLLLLGLLLLGLLPWAGGGGVAFGQEPSSLRLDLPGRLVSAAPTGQGRLWLLSEGEERPRLHLFVAGERPRLLLDLLPLPETVEEVASADCDGDGSPDPVALAPEAWWWIRGSPGSLELVRVTPEGPTGGRWTGPARRGIVAPSSAHPPAMAEPGTLRILGGDGRGFTVRARVPLPVSAEREPWGVRLSSPRLRPLSGGWLAWEEKNGPRIPLAWITEVGESRELDLRFPASEQVDSASPLVLGG